LEKSRLEDDLAKKLANRPEPEELIKENILNGRPSQEG
jgi:RPEL repeat